MSAARVDDLEVLKRLEHWSQRLRAALDLALAWESQQAQAAYREIKQDLRTEAHRMQTRAGRAGLTPAERRWYERAISQASAHLRAPINASPLSQRWRESVGEARQDIALAIARMKAVVGDAPEAAQS